MIISELKQCKLGEACQLFIDAYLHQRELMPILDEKNAHKEKIMSMLEWCTKEHLAVAAYESGKMVGYMTGFYVDEFLGMHKGAYSPEWTHGAVRGKAFECYRLMYQAIGQSWVKDGCITHGINLMSFAQEAREAFYWNGFGSLCIDAVRPVEPLSVEALEGFHIRALEEKDMQDLYSMTHEHYRHLATAAAFKPYLEPCGLEELQSMVKEPGNIVWMAWKGHEAAGYMKVAPFEDGAAWIVNGESKFAVNGAYIKPQYRGMGLARLLLSAIMAWAMKEGFKRCSVDFEAGNLEACRFWLRYFQPVCMSMLRRLDERILRSIEVVINPGEGVK